MEKIKDKIEDLAEDAAGILDTYYHLTVLNVAEKTSNIFSTAFASISLLFVGIFILFFAGIGLSIYFNDLLESNMSGYFIVAGIYLLIGLVLILLRKKIIFPFIRNTFIKKAYE
jgi:hypothetical protein